MPTVPRRASLSTDRDAPRTASTRRDDDRKYRIHRGNSAHLDRERTAHPSVRKPLPKHFPQSAPELGAKSSPSRVTNVVVSFNPWKARRSRLAFVPDGEQ